MASKTDLNLPPLGATDLSFDQNDGSIPWCAPDPCR